MRFFRLILLCGALAQVTAGYVAEGATVPKLGTKNSEIGTFNGWSGWVGWEGSFSDSYEPVKEKYAWAVYLAPEAVYVALQPSQAVYSGVDVNMGIKDFYGFLKAPVASQTLQAAYVSDLWSVSLSIGYPDGIPPVGLMAHFSMGFEIEQGFFRMRKARTLLPGNRMGGQVTARPTVCCRLPCRSPWNWIETGLRRRPSPSFPGFGPLLSGIEPSIPVSIRLTRCRRQPSTWPRTPVSLRPRP